MCMASNSLIKKLFFLAALSAAASAANAETYQFSGDTSNNFAAGGYQYHSLEFRVDAAGTYSFYSQANYDNAVYFFSPSFDPASPGTNALISNDNYTGPGNSGFNWDLTTGTTYVLVNTGANTEAYGAFSTEITGPGSVIAIAAVPEPEIYAMLLAGLGFMGAVARRKKSSAGQARPDQRLVVK